MAKNVKAIHLGLLGLGTVGSGVAELLERNRDLIESRVGAPVILKKALVRDLKRQRPGVPASVELTDSPASILEDPQIDLVVELMGGFEPAREYILKAAKGGKHVVTANKAVLAKHWEEIFQTAHDNQVDVYMEAAVGGGIPCVQSIADGLAANHIQNLAAIINGTCNYILTEMDAGKDFDEVLKIAQQKGYAEADPSFDIDGVDACHKLAILASICFDQTVSIESVTVQGIRGITRDDLKAAREEMNCAVKHLAVCRSIGEKGLEVRVAPMLVPLDHPLAQVDGVYNAVHLTGDAVGNVMFYGPGAGKMPTASAVMSDIIYVARNIAAGVAGDVPSIAFDIKAVKHRKILPPSEIENRFFLKISALDKPGVLARISGVLSEKGISISSIRQREKKKGDHVPILISTYLSLESDLRSALDALQAMDEIDGEALVMRLIEPEA